MNAAVPIFEVPPLHMALAVIGAVMAPFAIAIIVIHLRADDGANRQAADDAGRDLTIARDSGRRGGDSQGQCGNGRNSHDLQHV